MEMTEGWPPRRYAWYVVSLLMLAYALSILDRTAIALLIGPIKSSLNISDTQFGLLQGLAFSIIYSVLGLPFGILCDHWLIVRVLVLGILVWSLATVAGGFARNFSELFMARMFVGVGEAALVPVASSLIADHFTSDVRPKAYGAFVAGSSIGSITAMICSSLFLIWADHLIVAMPAAFGHFSNWQLVFAMCGAPGFLLAAVIALSVREPVRKGVLRHSRSFDFRAIYNLLRIHPGAYGGLIGGTVLNMICTYAVVGWLPALFIRDHGWSAAKAGLILGAVGAPISLFTAFNSGWFISSLVQRGHREAPIIAALGAAVTFALFGPIASLSSSPTIAIIAYAGFSFFSNWNLPALYSGMAQITPNDLRGQVMAIHTIASGAIALAGGNFIVGYLSDRVFIGPHGIGPALAAVFLLSGSAAAVVLWFSRKAFGRAAANPPG